MHSNYKSSQPVAQWNKSFAMANNLVTNNTNLIWTLTGLIGFGVFAFGYWIVPWMAKDSLSKKEGPLEEDFQSSFQAAQQHKPAETDREERASQGLQTVDIPLAKNGCIYIFPEDVKETNLSPRNGEEPLPPSSSIRPKVIAEYNLAERPDTTMAHSALYHPLTKALRMNVDFPPAEQKRAELTAVELKSAIWEAAEREAAELKGAELQAALWENIRRILAKREGAELKAAELKAAKQNYVIAKAIVREQGKTANAQPELDEVLDAELERAKLVFSKWLDVEEDPVEVERVRLELAELEAADRKAAEWELVEPLSVTEKILDWLRTQLKIARQELTELQQDVENRSALKSAACRLARLQAAVGKDARQEHVEMKDAKRELAKQVGAKLIVAKWVNTRLKIAKQELVRQGLDSLGLVELELAEQAGVELERARLELIKLLDLEQELAELNLDELKNAELEFVELEFAELLGATLKDTRLQGADLRIER